jgi:hypothetical protein
MKPLFSQIVHLFSSDVGIDLSLMSLNRNVLSLQMRLEGFIVPVEVGVGFGASKHRTLLDLGRLLIE